MQTNAARGERTKPREIMEFDQVALGRRVRAGRIDAGWTQDQLAEQTGLSRNTIGAIERGAASPQPVLAALRVLGLPEDPKADDRGVLQRVSNELLMAEVLRRLGGAGR